MNIQYTLWKGGSRTGPASTHLIKSFIRFEIFDFGYTGSGFRLIKINHGR